MTSLCRTRTIDLALSTTACRLVDEADSATTSMAGCARMTLKSYQYRDPGEVVAQIAGRYELVDGDVLLVLVRDPSQDQEIVHVTRLEPKQWRDRDRDELEELLAAEARRMPVPVRGFGAPRHSIMTIVARRGFAVISASDAKWLPAWLYSNHLVDAFSGDVIVVTEHGWVDFTTGWGGHEPCVALNPMGA
jgi:hypothetical protein